MKLLKCIIHPDKLDDVRAALAGIQVKGMTISEVMGLDRRHADIVDQQRDHPAVEPAARCEVEVVAPDHRVRQVLETVMLAARSGRGDDGKIFIMNVDQAVRIRTGECDDAAL